MEDSKTTARRDREELLLRGREAFAKKISSKKRLIDDELLGEFYVFPMSIREKQAIYSTYQLERLVSLARMIVVRCKNEDGTQIFRPADIEDVCRLWDAEDVERIARKIQEDVDDADAATILEGEAEQPGN